MSNALSDEVLQHFPLPVEASVLPNGWSCSWLSEVASDIGPGFASGEHSSDRRGVPHLRPMNVDRDGKIDLQVVKYVASSEGVELRAGDILFNNTNSPELIGKTALISENASGYAYSNHMTRIRLDRDVSPSYVSSYLHFLWMSRYSKHRCTNHVNQASISSKTLAYSMPFLLPPRKEQTRIVAKLEELLSDLDAGVAELKAAQKKLTQYRQSLLKAAVEGALTKEWRERRGVNGGSLPMAKAKIASTGSARTEKKNRSGSSYSVRPEPVEGFLSVRDSSGSKYGIHRIPLAEQGEGVEAEESGAQLLIRILKERRARWEAKQLAKFNEQGKAPPKDWQEKYPEPVKPDTTNLPELPESWVWASLDQLTEFITSGSRGWAEYYSIQGATFVRSQNINKDWLDLSDIAFVTPPQSSEGTRTRVQMHDLLLTITGANVGKAAHVNVELEEAYVSQHVALIRPIQKGISDFLHMFLTASVGGRGQLNKEAYGAGKPGLNLQQVGTVAVPLPGSQEVGILLEALLIQLKAVGEQEEFIGRAFVRCSAQRKNILKAAFSGQLVPQDPNDEPASVLLERIRAERVANGAGRKPQKRIKDAV